MPTLGTGTLGTAGGLRVAERRLQTLADSLGELHLEEEVDQAARLLRGELPLLPDYNALPEDQKGFYDIATGLQGASALLMPAILSANDGLARIKTPNYEYTFTVPTPAEREAWAGEIADAAEYLTRYVRSLNPPKRKSDFSMFGAAGVARARARDWAVFDRAGYIRRLLPLGW